MTESDFWLRLEYRICHELEGSTDHRLRWLWCDGLLPDRYEFAADPPRIDGRAWFGDTGQDNWTFALTLSHAIRSMNDIDWAMLLPADDVHGWLRVDYALSTLRINRGDGLRASLKM